MKFRTQWWHVGWLLIGLAGCDQPARTVSGVDTGVEGAVILSDFTTGRLVFLNQEGAGVPTHGDAIVRASAGGGWLVVNRLGGDNLQRVDADGKVQGQFSLGRGTNPQDVLEWNGGYWVSHLRRPELVWWTGEGKVEQTVDLSAHCDADGFAEPTYFHSVGDHFYVLLQRLNVEGSYEPAGGSRILEVDPVRGEIVRTLPLKLQNPVTPFKTTAHHVWVGAAGFRGKRDGGIERWDLKRGEGEVVVTESALGGDLVDFVPRDEVSGVAIIARGNVTALVSFSPQGVKPWPKPWKVAQGFYWMQLRRWGSRLLLVDRNPTRPGIHVLEGETSVDFWAMALPPYWLELR